MTAYLKKRIKLKFEKEKITERFLSRLVAAIMVLGFLYVIKIAPEELQPARRLANQPAIALGALIILAWVMGDIFQKVGLPRITGYMVTGLLAGPYGLKLISKNSVQTLKFIDNLALALIALHAGHRRRAP